jgi:hypothetical protein
MLLDWPMLLGIITIIARTLPCVSSSHVLSQLRHAPQHVNERCPPSKIASPRVLFSITTTLHIPGKHLFVEEAINSLVLHHPDHASMIGRWLLINEYSECHKEEVELMLQHLKARFSFLEVIQKSAYDQGQPKSLNIILRELRSGDFPYWLHIEESWRTMRPFLEWSVDFLDDHRYLHQLQLYQAAYYTSHTHTRITEDVEVIALDSYIDLTDVDPRDWHAYSLKWPSYSLRPSLTQVSFLKANPHLTFNAEPAWFPVVFEFAFSIQWQLSGGSMCALSHAAVIRQEGHTSTYVL